MVGGSYGEGGGDVVQVKEKEVLLVRQLMHWWRWSLVVVVGVVGGGERVLLASTGQNIPPHMR